MNHMTSDVQEPRFQTNIDEALNYVWRELKDSYIYYSNFDKKLIFVEENKADFIARFHEIYSNTKDKYMRKNVVELDRHKVVAAQITACIETNLITRKVNKGEVFLGLYMIALEVALNWMIIGLNDELKKVGIVKKIDRYIMPDAFACSTRYFDIFARNLYYSHVKGNGLNPLDIAEKLFLLEYITLLKNDIDPTILKYQEN